MVCIIIGAGFLALFFIANFYSVSQALGPVISRPIVAQHASKNIINYIVFS